MAAPAASIFSMTKSTLHKDLWKPRSSQETRDLYTEWAGSYDADVTSAGYATPGRIAAALAGCMSERTAPVLDFGCGTGLSGLALAAQGFTTLDGTDITPEMLKRAETTGAYRHLWLGDPDLPPTVTAPGYRAITATGVVSLGAAPPETLSVLLALLNPGDLLALSYNDATLADPRFTDAMATACAGAARMRVEEYGPHLVEKDMGSTVYVLEKT